MSEKYLERQFYFEEIKLILNFYGFNFDSEVAQKYIKSGAVEKVKGFISKLEKGDHVNTSEDRGVDHYNLRMKEEKVNDKSLSKSIKLWNEIKDFCKKIIAEKKYTDVVFNGIGGSILGPVMMTIFEKGIEYYYDDLPIKPHFVSNSDSDSFASICNQLDLEKTLVVTMSKSGGTAETMTNYRVFTEIFQKKYPKKEIGPNNICITTKGSKLDKFAEENKFVGIFHMNTYTGGRTSIGSAIGMIVAGFLEFDFEQFLKGQSVMDELTRNFDDITKNPAMLIALATFNLLKEGTKNMIVLGYSDFLKEYSHYLQQLYMESIGKEKNLEGKTVNEGLTVFGGVGTGEQHAFMQQVQKGLNDCFVKFMYFSKRKNDYVNPSSGSMGRQLLSFIKGTEHALLENGKKFLSLGFEERNLFNLGLMIALDERIVTILAILKDINAYDQPGVELGKKSSNIMNDLSLKLEKLLSEEKGEVEGNVDFFKKKYNLEYPLYFIDAVLGDISSNVEVKDSFPLLYKKIVASKKFVEGKGFTYNFKKL